MPYTVVSFHAHPDDEAILTAGTLARAAAEGHTVVIVTATDGGEGLAGPVVGEDLGRTRMDELRAAAAAVGCHDVRHLGYDDSGMDGRAGRDGRAFSRVAVEEAAERLAAVLRQVGASVVTVYDPAGGYGHPDHLQVHRVGVAAAERAGTPVVLEATVDRRPLLRVLRVLARLGMRAPDWAPERFEAAFADPERITHRVDVRAYAGRKRSAMAAHRSQATGGQSRRTLAVLTRLPAPLFRLAFAREWFVERGRHPGARPLDDIFASLRESSG